LLLACLQAAVGSGAEVLNHHQLVKLEKHDGLFQAGIARTAIDASEQTIEKRAVSARLVVDCTGSGHCLEREYLQSETIPANDDSVYLKATNLVVKKRLSSHALGIQAQDDSGMSRLLFIAPWGEEYSLIGTWYYPGEAQDDQSVSEPEIQDCIDQVNSAFEKPMFSTGDVVQVHLGHLPADPAIAASKGPDAALKKHSRLRDWGKLDAENEGLYSLQGTKYTLARRAAEDTVSLLGRKHRFTLSPSISATRPLWQSSPQAAEQLAGLGWQTQQIGFVLEYFALAIDKIIAIGKADQEMNAPIPGAEVCCKAVIEYCLRTESVRHLTDLLVRRLPLGNAELPARPTIDYVAEKMAQRFSWTPQRCGAEIEQLEGYYMKAEPMEVTL
ncbi:MAG: hypothetical protein HKN85_11530, partial [Gammaproteobacteria bacterium]|nr:hypothetical protein [Gammaproteobacteria bacterium]